MKACGKTQRKDHDDHIAEKAFNSLSRYNLVHKISGAPSDEKSGCENSSGQGMEDARKVASLAIDQGKEQKREVILEAQKRNTVHFCCSDGHSPQTYRVGTNKSEIQRPGRAPRGPCERRFWLVCCVHRGGFVCINDGRETNGCHCKTT